MAFEFAPASALLMQSYAIQKERQIMKKIDVDKDARRSRFLIVAMIAQILVVLLVMFAYLAWLKS